MEASSRNPDTSGPSTLSSRGNARWVPNIPVPHTVNNYHFHHVVAGSLVPNISPQTDNKDVDWAPPVMITVVGCILHIDIGVIAWYEEDQKYMEERTDGVNKLGLG